MMSGILVLNKEQGITSHQAVAHLRRILRTSHVGHTGTLDPEATGVLVAGIGQATRAFSFLREDTKSYRAEVILGQSTDTQDATGAVTFENLECQVHRDTITHALTQLTGEIWQTPPMYSAVKIQGRKLYELARQGLEIERKSRKITVFRWDNHYTHEVYAFKEGFMAEIVCSKGTYIRTLIHDLGALLGCGAHMGRLLRLSSGDFSLKDAHTLAEVEHYQATGRLAEILIPLDRALGHLPEISLDKVDFPKIVHGGKLSYAKYPLPVSLGDLARVKFEGGDVCAVVSLQEAQMYQFWQPKKVFRDME